MKHIVGFLLLCLLSVAQSNEVLCEHHLPNKYKLIFYQCLMDTSEAWRIRNSCLEEIELYGVEDYVYYFCGFDEDLTPLKARMYQVCLERNSIKEVEEEESRTISIDCLHTTIGKVLKGFTTPEPTMLRRSNW